MKTLAENISTYRSLRAAGMSEADATKAMIRDHGLSFDAAVDLAWQAARGHSAPKPGSRAAIRHEAAATNHDAHTEE
jgi:hypothetical protein